MDPANRVAYVHSQCICAMAELLSMQALNQLRESLGQAQAYDEQAFLAVQDKYMINHNAVISYLTGR